MINDYLSLSTRAGFNKSLAHFRMVTDMVKRLNQGENLADIVDTLEKSTGLEKSQIGPILNAIVIDRMESKSRSFNLSVDVQDFEKVLGELEKWNRMDIVIAYHHPQLGISLINPKQKSHWESVREFNRDELVVLYIRAFDEADKHLEEDALTALEDLLYGRPISGTEKFGGAQSKPKAAPPPPPRAASAAPPAPASMPVPSTPVSSAPTPSAPPPPRPAAPPAGASGVPIQEPAPPPPPPAARGKVRMTPKYSVQVSNELFHNGNVEAWKNIVESYKTKFPGMEVHIFHDGQKINNINSLFKWGKVKHGDVILFSVAGEVIKGVAKLQRYLYEGASIRFEKYLKKDVNKVLSLF